jgi:hypothetical protein
MAAKKNVVNPPTNPVDQLPAATQVGANTFGCLINGKAFTNGGSAFSGNNLACFYGYFYTTTPTSPYSGFSFLLNASDLRNTCNITGITIAYDSLEMQQGNTYLMGTLKAGQGNGQYLRYPCGASDSAFTTSDTTTMGQLNLTRLDQGSQIASGTFWFNVINSEGDTVKITDGRFDVYFSN